jgi:hypothetical protein
LGTFSKEGIISSLFLGFVPKEEKENKSENWITKSVTPRESSGVAAKSSNET